jgi:hypothetical protein
MKSGNYLLLLALIIVAAPAKSQVPAEPLKPEKADSNSPVIRLDIDTKAFPELAIYDNLQFQLDPHGRKFDLQDAHGT